MKTKKPPTKRDYCTTCGRWIITWQQTPWSDHSWQNPVLRPAFERMCEHGRYCTEHWSEHETKEHA
jgi:hypothetical protein